MKFSVKFKADDVRKMFKDLKKEFRDGADGARAGYYEGEQTKDGKATLSEIALVNEFGANINIPPHTVTNYRQVNKAGTGFNKEGRFVKKKDANFAQDHQVDGYTVTIPSRPFIRNAEAKIQESASEIMQKGLQDGKTLNRIIREVAEDMRNQIVESITSNTPPPNKPSTIRQKKGSTGTLRDTGQLRDSVHIALVKDGQEKPIGK